MRTIHTMTRSKMMARAAISLLLICLTAAIGCGDSTAFTAYDGVAVDQPSAPSSTTPQPGPADQPFDEPGVDEPAYDEPGFDESNEGPLDSTEPTQQQPINGGEYPHSGLRYDVNEEGTVFLENDALVSGPAVGAITIVSNEPITGVGLMLDGAPAPTVAYFRTHSSGGGMGAWTQLSVQTEEFSNARLDAEFGETVTTFDLYIEDPSALTALLVWGYPAGSPAG